ncbi:MAG: antiporter, family [Betaproteobacteria bacterium]|jgi:AAA family ATP:ADP antiporter|nr:antiporter, family [Betaproteobacteria bacterium]
MLWSFAYFFCLLSGYYILRPLRDEMGVAGGVRNLQWLFTATFLVMLAAVPIYGALVARLPRRLFIPLVYHFFVANLLIFWLLLTLDVERQTVARVFFVWISVFVLFAVSVFWSFMADLFSSEQSKRLYGFIAAGGSAGALAGPALTIGLAESIGAVNLLIVAALLLEGAVFCAMRLDVKNETREKAVGGGAIDGLMMVLRSPYIAGVMLWVSLMSVAATFLYFEQAAIVAAASDDPAVRTRIFAAVDLAVGVLTIAVQFFATGKLIERFGIGAALALLPLVFAAGFAVLAAAPILAVVIAFQALQRTANFAISNPAREALFTVVARDEKYKAKNVVDIVAVRGADAAGGWLFTALRSLGMEVRSIPLAAILLAVGGVLLAAALGRAQERRAATPKL